MATTTISSWPSFALVSSRRACLKEFGIPPNHSTWCAASLEVKSVDPPQAYSPLMLPSFNEEEMLEEASNEVLEKTPEVADKLG